jgi:hypothetical protein
MVFLVREEGQMRGWSIVTEREKALIRRESSIAFGEKAG